MTARQGWTIALQVCTVVGLMSPLSHAGLIGFESELHTGNDAFSIHNTSDPGYLISKVELYLGDGMQFDTVAGGAAFDPVSVPLAVNVGLIVPHFTNSILATPYATGTSAAVGYTGTLASDVIDGGTSAVFEFSDFERGEAWGITVDYDTFTGDDDPAGDAMNNALIVVSFSFNGEFFDTLSFQYPTFNSNSRKVSFPTDTGDLQGPFKVFANEEVPAMPEPSSTGLLTMASVSFIGYGWLRRRLSKPRLD